MATCLEYSINGDSISNGEIEIVNFAFVGFKISKDKSSGVSSSTA